MNLNPLKRICHGTGRIRLLLTLFAGIAMQAPLAAQTTATDAVRQMQKGINLGNTFDAPGGETSWGNPVVQAYYFDDYKAAGFTAVRIPVTWDQHVQAGAPYTIDATFLNRVEQVVDWGLARGLFIIVNAHHEGWLKGNFSQANQARFQAIWQQIAQRFANKSDHLLFEILNEPQPMALGDLNTLNPRILGIIRNSGGNNFTRNVVYAGTNFSGGGDLKQASIPSSDHSHLIANFHDYSPWSFVSDSSGTMTWGTAADKSGVVSDLTNIKNWANSNNLGLMMNEWGCGPAHEYNSRMDFFESYVSAAGDLGISAFTWDDGGGFQIYNRNGRSWVGDVKDVITNPVFSQNGVKAVGYYRSGGTSGVQREATTDSGNSHDVGFIDTGDWMRYHIDVPAAGSYKLELRVASTANTGVIRVEKAGGSPVYGTLNVPSTGGWQTWTTLSGNITLPAGTTELAIAAQVGGFNLNWIKLTQVQNSATPTPTKAPTATATSGSTATSTPTTTPLPGGAGTIVNKNSGKCVDAAGSGTANDTHVQQWACNGSNAQGWSRIATDSGYVRIGNNNNTNQVIDIAGPSTTDGALAHLWTYGGGTNQQWLPVAEGSTGYVHLVVRNSGKCLDVPSASTADGVQLQQWTCNGSAAQSFKLN